MATINIGGLKEFQRSLKRVDAGMPRLLRVVFNEAMGLVVGYARDHMPKRTGQAAASLKPKSQQRTARISMGGQKAPWAPWLDFGGEGRVKGRPPHRQFVKGGRYVYKGLAVKHQEITDVMARGIADVARQAGLQVS